MTKKHFIALAKSLAFLRPLEPSQSDGRLGELYRQRFQQWQADVIAVATVCESFNTQFDKSRFLSAVFD